MRIQKIKFKKNSKLNFLKKLEWIIGYQNYFSKKVLC